MQSVFRVASTGRRVAVNAVRSRIGATINHSVKPSSINKLCALCPRPSTTRTTSASSQQNKQSNQQSNNQIKYGAQGDEYILRPEQVAAYHRDGYITVSNVLSEDELKPIETIYEKFMNGEVDVPGKDFCDMSGDFSVKREDFAIVNAMLPRVYYPELQNNLYEKRAASIIKQLFHSNEFDIDYDQLLAKKPTKKQAVFAWHVDLAYWPLTPDTRTATCSLALDATTRANGCLRFVAGSHLEPEIRSHRPVNEDRNKAHAIVCDVDERSINNPNGKDIVNYTEIARGDLTIHNERVVHGSGGNFTNGWRRTYVIAFRHQSTIDLERQAGFTHSHNDTVNWDTFHNHLENAEKNTEMQQM